MKTYRDCHGCGLCALVCPVYTQQSDISLTPWGRAKALQGGASALDIKDSIESCLLCGACQNVCPEDIPVFAEETLLRQAVKLPFLKAENFIDNSQFHPSPDFAIQSQWMEKMKSQLSGHAKKNEVISDKFSLHLSFAQGKKKGLHGLGEWLIKKKLIQSKITSEDLYWMDARIFHNQYQRLLKTYDAFRKSTGCQINWNLHRIAMTLGEENPFFEREKQFRWVIRNKKINRILVENVQDWKWLKENSEIPTLHIMELLL